jgi:hypothetical protein
METSSRSCPGRAPWRWNPWPVCIVAWFTAAIVGCGTFIFFCNRHPADLVAPDYYEQEVHYQGQIERVQHARQRAQSASVIYDANLRLIRISLPPGQGQANATGSIQLYRPSAMDEDRQFQFKPGRDGVQDIETANLRPGLWEVRVSWTVDRQDYFMEQRIVIGPPAS